MNKRLKLILGIILLIAFIATSLGLTAITVKSIKLDTTSVRIIVGKTHRLNVIIMPENANNKKVTYSSANRKIATVDKYGNIKGIIPGKTVITVTSVSNKKAVAKCNVTISQNDKYNPEITLTTVRSTNPIPSHETETYSNNNPYKIYKNKLGINVKNLWEVDQAQYEQKGNLMIASSDLPDFFIASLYQFNQLNYGGLLYDITEVWRNYASDLSIQNVEKIKEMWDLGKKNNKIMGIPRGGLISTPMLWIRKDWRENVGINKQPTSLDELLQLVEAFVTKDPDQDKKANTIGFTGKLFSPWEGLRGLFYAWGAYPETFIKDSSGKVVYGSIQQNVRKALQAMQTMYKRGMIDNEFPIRNAKEARDSEKLGIQISGQWGASAWNVCVTNNSKAKIEWLPIPSEGGGAAKIPHSVPAGDLIVISKKCKNPEAIIKMVNLNFELVWNSTETEWKFYNSEDIDGKYYYHRKYDCINIGSPYEHYNVAKVADTYWKTKKLGTKDVYAGLVIKPTIDYLSGEGKDWFQAAHWGPGGSITSVYKSLFDNNLIFYNQYNNNPTETMQLKWQLLLDKEREVFSKIVMGEKIEKFDEFVSDWKKLGGDTITQELNKRNGLE